MIEVSQRLWVGSAEDCAMVRGSVTATCPGVGDWFILSCAKEPFHRQAIGYTSPAAPKDHPEYLFAYRGNRLILNMVDAISPDFFPAEMVNAGLHFIDVHLKEGAKVLVHCNQGESRGPGMAMLYLLAFGGIPAAPIMNNSFAMNAAVEAFKEIYPPFNPKAGILGVIKRRIFPDAQDWSMNPIAVKAGHQKEKPAANSGEDWFLKLP